MDRQKEKIPKGVAESRETRGGRCLRLIQPNVLQCYADK